MTSDAHLSARPSDLNLNFRLEPTEPAVNTRCVLPPGARSSQEAPAAAGTRVTATVAANEGRTATVADRGPGDWWMRRRMVVVGLAVAGLAVVGVINPVAVGAALGTGFLNIASGGGAVVVFLALTMIVGVPALTAHATSQFTTPASFLSVLSLVKEYWPGRGLLMTGYLGTIVGVAALTVTPADTFQLVAPFVLILAGLLVVFQGPVQGRIQRAGWRLGPRTTVVLMFGCGVYAGIIGVGTGTLALVVLGLTPRYANTELQQLLLTRNVLLLGMAGIVSVAFIVTGLVNWALAALLVLPGAVGGWIGIKLVKRLPVPLLRGLIATTAGGGAAWLWLR